MVFFLSPLLPAATRMEKRASIATPKATGSETSQCQDGPSRAYRRGRLWGVGGVWPENPTLTGDNCRQSQVGSTNIGIGNCAWGKRQLVNISGHGDRGMASSPSRDWMPIMDPRVWTFFFSRPSVDEMQSLQSPFVCPLPLPSCRLALTTSSCLCSSSPAPISVSTFRSAARKPPDPWPPSARVDRRKRSIPASPRPGHRGGGLGGEARPRCQSRRARAAGASAREWKPSGHPWKLRCEANSKRTVHQHRERKIQCHGAFPCRPHPFVISTRRRRP